MRKFIFVSGGVCSGLGKGVSASSIGALLECRGLNVRMVKCDPYINVDAGTMNPFQHGEVYVTDDGTETDLDLGNYARFTAGRLSTANSVTTGQVYKAVLDQERAGAYLGKCVQVIPHITDEIKCRIMAVADEEGDTDVVIVEIGGTVGDIESVPFLETARQIIQEHGRENALCVHLTLILEVSGGELKTKPTQHSVKAMQAMGLQPDILICRAPDLLDGETRKKLALFTNMDPAAVFTSRNIDTTMYELPLVFFDQKLDEVVLRKLCLEPGPADLGPWKSMMARFAERKGIVRIALVGKYMELDDAYKSVFEALFHAGLACGVEVRVIKVNSEEVEAGSAEVAALFAEGGDSQLDGVLIPGGFGDRGIAGIVRTAGWARRNKVPCFGVCLGMQLMVIEWCRNVIGWKDADSGEFSKDTTHPVISLLEELRGVTDYGGTMRLGSGESVALPGTLIHAAYSRSASGTAGPDGKVSLWERHRHRYEFSNRFRQEMVDSGLIIAALTPDGTLVESVQWPDHPWGVGVQFHPEFKSKPTAAAPLFRDFIAAAKERMLGRPDAKAE